MAWTAENRFLRTCLPLRPPADAGALLNALATTAPDWDEILRAATWHGVAPIVYRNLKQLEHQVTVPATFMTSLRQLYLDNLTRNVYIQALTNQLLTVLHDNGIEPIVMKGMALAEEVYGDIALRPMGDIDLLIRRDELARAETCFTDMGFTLDAGVARDWLLEHHYELMYIDPHHDVPVDLHWHIDHERLPTRIRIDNDALIDAWRDRARTVNIAGRQARILSPADTVFHLCQHFLKSRFAVNHGGFVSKAGLLQLSDIAHLMMFQRDRIDWQQLASDAAGYRMDSLVGATLLLAVETVFGDDVALPEIEKHLTIDAADREMATLVKELLFKRKDADRPISKTVLKAAGGASLRSRLSGLVSVLFPRKESLAKKFDVAPDSGKVYLYYFLHPFTLLSRRKDLGQRVSRVRDESALKRWIGDKH